MLAQIRNMPERKDPARNQYDYAHYQAHAAICAAIKKATGRTLILRPIWPVTDMRIFLQSHQAMHDDMNRSQGFPGTDLTKLDDEDEIARKDWGWRNYQQHQQIQNKL